ncbi:MAG: ankyrin repeat domain-containing protein [Simkaniaceae bacterium]|nr:ankyrin repeat domain-containing protein [Simkaniaceae bacterium]
MRYIYLFLLVPLVAFTEPQYIRAFDLGGGGLKTALLAYEEGAHRMEWVQEPSSLGKCPDNMHVSQWIRERLLNTMEVDIDEEIAAGYHFAFSLAGLNKLCARERTNPNIASLFAIPPSQMRCIDDGAAHLVASMEELDLPKGPIFNFSIGTGVGIGYAEQKGSIKRISDLNCIFGLEIWKTTVVDQHIFSYFCCSSRNGFDQLVAQNNGVIDDTIFLTFASRWKKYFDHYLFPKLKKLPPPWDTPSSIVFTGGHTERHGRRLERALKQLQIGVPVYTGPRRAGLLGAAWYAVREHPDQLILTEAIKSLDIERIQSLLNSGIEVNLPDRTGIRALARAVELDSIEVVKLLLSYGAEINAIDCNQQTPLYLAKSSQMIELLLENGANPDNLDNWKLKPKLSL